MISEDEIQLVWNRQPYDTDASFAAFRDYYLPQSNPRSVVEAYRRSQAHKGIDSSAVARAPGQWQRWSRCWTNQDVPRPNSMTWQQRAQAYDDYQADLRLRELEARRAKLLEDEWQHGASLFNLAREIISRGGDFITTKRRVIEAKYDKDGRQISPEREIIVTSLNAGLALQALQVADKLARLSVGEPTENVGVQYKIYDRTDEFDPDSA